MKLAELYQEAARVANMIEGEGVKYSDCIKINGEPVWIMPTFLGKPEDYEFALAIVEGKPVFKGDCVFNIDYPNGIEAERAKYLYNLTGLKSFSLTKLKPKTVMVELLREDAERCKEHFGECFPYSDGKYTARVFIACKKALEE